MNLIQLLIALSTFLCSLVAGFLLAFTIVVMPGIKNLGDHDYLQAFKGMDRIIQNNQPVFITVWLGSVVALLASAILGFWRLEGLDLVLLFIAAAMYLFGVQVPTVTINVPLNNQLQQQDLGALSEPALQEAREQFEPRWIQWNTIRTVVSTLTSILLIFLVYRL